MQVTVRYFAALREQKGSDEETVGVTTATDVASLFATLFQGSPLAGLPVLFAVNQAYVSADTLLRDGDEVAFIPPLGGG